MLVDDLGDVVIRTSVRRAWHGRNETNDQCNHEEPHGEPLDYVMQS